MGKLTTIYDTGLADRGTPQIEQGSGSVSVNPDMFGATQARELAQVGDIAGTALKIMHGMKVREDESIVNGRLSDFNLGITERLYGEKGALLATGDESYKITENTRKAIEDERKKYQKDLTPSQVALFINGTDKAEISFLTKSAVVQGLQIKKHSSDMMTRNIDSHINLFNTGGGSVEDYDETVQEITDIAGGNTDIINDGMGKLAYSNMVKLVDNNDPKQAQEFLKSNDAQYLTMKEKIAFGKIIKKKTYENKISVKALDLSEMEHDKALDKIIEMKKKDLEQGEDVETAYLGIYNTEQKAITERSNSALYKAISLAEQGEQVPASYTLDMTPRARIALTKEQNRIKKGELKITQRNAFANLSDMYQNDYQKFSKINLMDYFNDLTTTDMKYFITRQDKGFADTSQYEKAITKIGDLNNLSKNQKAILLSSIINDGDVYQKIIKAKNLSESTPIIMSVMTELQKTDEWKQSSNVAEERRKVDKSEIVSNVIKVKAITKSMTMMDNDEEVEVVSGIENSYILKAKPNITKNEVYQYGIRIKNIKENVNLEEIGDNIFNLSKENIKQFSVFDLDDDDYPSELQYKAMLEFLNYGEIDRLTEQDFKIRVDTLAKQHNKETE